MKNAALKALGLLLAISALVPATALAHHSFSMFDQTKVVALEGTVTEFQWTNPHTFIEMDVVQDGQTKHYSVESGSIRQAKAMGMVRTTLKPGQKIKAEIHPLRDGRDGGAMKTITANGKIYKFF